ncbi:hypothetical protein GCM10008110_07520 [Marinobacter persicus]|nr:hypothetical protein GCM10008110_07520 [Marinobacter persicus]
MNPVRDRKNGESAIVAQYGVAGHGVAGQPLTVLPWFGYNNGLMDARGRNATQVSDIYRVVYP